MPREYQFPFELRHLVYFHEVARHLHFRKAGEALSLAQPALSRQIAQLEQDKVTLVRKNVELHKMIERLEGMIKEWRKAND